MDGRNQQSHVESTYARQKNQAELEVARTSAGLESQSTDASQAWFVPEPEDGPAPLVSEVPEGGSALSYNDYPTSTLPVSHVSGIREELEPSAWGPNAVDNDVQESSDAPPSSLHLHSVPENRPRMRLFSSGSNWSAAIPDVNASPRSPLLFTEQDGQTTPLFSAHRSARASSVSAPRSPDFLSPSGSPLSPTRLPASPPMPNFRPPMPTIPAPVRDSYETTDGSTSMVSGSFQSGSSSNNSSRQNAADYSDDEETMDSGSISLHARFTNAQQNRDHMTIGSVPNPSSITSPRGSGDLSGSSSAKVTTKSVGRIPRTKSVALNPMQQTIRSGPAIANATSNSSITSPASTAMASPTSSPHGSIGLRRDSAIPPQGLQALQSIPAPIAAALNIVEANQAEMKLGGDVHLLEWAWDSHHKHNFIKVSTDHSSCTWSSSTNYGLVRSNKPLTHPKTFIEIAKTRGISQHLYVGVAKPSVDFNCSPAKLQFNPVTVAGEWAAVWIKVSTTGDRFGVLFDLETHKLTVHRNGVPTYTTDIPTSFHVPAPSNESQATGELESDTSGLSINHASSSNGDSSSHQNSHPSPPRTPSPSLDTPTSDLYPFIGMCGDQDILITDMPEFEKYETITWAHSRKPQFHATEEVLEGVPAILEMLGLGKLRPKFEGMSVNSFQKLKDADLRKLGTTVEQRRRLLSQIETTK